MLREPGFKNPRCETCREPTGRALSHNPFAPLHSSDVITIKRKTAFAIEHFGANLDSPHTKVRGKLVDPEVLGIVFCPLDSPCLLYTSPSPRDRTRSRMPSSA